MSAPAVKLDRVTKSFSGHSAVRNLSLDIPTGCIFGLLGPNGAGKSTTIRMIIDIIRPDEGGVTLFGSSRSSRDLSSRVGYLPEERGLYKRMQVLEHLIFLGQTKGLSRNDSRARACFWLNRLGIAQWSEKRVEDLSKGMQQKVQFASALLHDPELVVLDEPFSGLDPINAQVMKEIVTEIASSGRTVLLSTHMMEQAERMCESIAIIAEGQLVLSGSIAQVKSEFGGSHVALGFRDGGGPLGTILNDRNLVATFDNYGVSAEVQMVDGVDPSELLARLVREAVVLSKFEVVEASLHSIFIAKVGASSSVAHRTGDLT